MRRNKKMKKAYKGMLKELDNMLGEREAGLYLCLNLRVLKKLVEDANAEDGVINLRTLEVTINDFFSSKWDFEREELVC